MAKLNDRWIVSELTPEENDYRMASESSILRWWHIPAGKNVTVTIVKIQKAKDKKIGKSQLVFWLKGKELPYLTNATALKACARLFASTNPHEWVGRRFTLYRTKTEMNGEEVPCLRIRPQLPGTKIEDTPIDESAKPPEEYPEDAPPPDPFEQEGAP
jgi:hypothetical protein